MTAAGMVVALNDVLVSGQEVVRESSIEGNGGDRTGTHSWGMFAKPIGDLEKRLSIPQLKDLGLYPAMRTESFQKYVNKPWKAFLTEGDAEDWMKAYLACSVRSVAAQLKSLMVLSELKKKAANAIEAISQIDKIKECLNSTVALVESAKLAYEKARQDMAEDALKVEK
ncbi:hypothetical protein Adt_39395 [Abeliophyllum distichum]|uniref:Uncharacterized protein n=1 Tax=Abeliophyllum distichum TaxID=126358 RepID=A0ABD1Q4Y9_9LAMI